MKRVRRAWIEKLVCIGSVTKNSQDCPSTNPPADMFFLILSLRCWQGHLGRLGLVYTLPYHQALYMPPLINPLCPKQNPCQHL